MRVAFFTFPLAWLMCVTAASAQPPPRAPTPNEIQADEKTLQDVKVGTDDAALLEYFRKLTHNEPSPKRVAELIDDLGDKSFRKRETAYEELFSFGGAALSALRKASLKTREQPEVSVERLRRLEDLIKRLEEKVNPQVQVAVARLLAARKPAAAAEVMLGFLPFAADEYVVRELCDALTLLAVRDGKTDPALLLGVGDKVAVRRGAAAAALLRAGVKEQLPRLRPLLQDPEAKVRLHVALALVGYKDNAAIGPLVGVLEHLTPEELTAAEEVLLRLAGKDAPNIALGTDAGSRKQAAEAWAAWWAKAKDNVDLAKIDLERLPVGFTVAVWQTRIVKGGAMGVVGQVVELDRHKKVRWSFDVTGLPVDVQVLGNQRVLVTEYSGLRVTERDFKGNIKWEIAVGTNPLSARRLANGNTLVVSRNGVSEYDAAGKMVFTHQRLNFDCYRGGKLPNGDLVVVTFQGQVERIDAKTKQVVKSFFIGNNLGNQWGAMEVLPNGNLLVGLSNGNKVVEYTADGEKKWEANAQQPISAQRLPNGNTLVVSQSQRRVYELDANGQQVDVIDFNNQNFLYGAQRR